MSTTVADQVAIQNHIADLVLREDGRDPESVRLTAKGGGGNARAALAYANAIAGQMIPHLLAFRDLVAAAEEAGWDGDPANAAILNRAREAHAALTGWSN